MKKLFVGLLLFILFLAPGCDIATEVSFTDISTLISMTKNLVDLAKDFGQGSEEIKTNIVNSTAAAAEKISATSDQQEMASATQVLSEQWTDITSEYGRLQRTLTNINDSATLYFTKLSTNNSFIKNADLKQKDMELTTELRTKWQAQYDIAVNDMRAVDSLVTQGNDFKVAMTNAIARTQVNTFLDSLKNISSEARRLAGEIRDFSRNVVDLFQAANIPTYDDGAKRVDDAPAARPERVDTTSPKRDVDTPVNPTPMRSVDTTAIPAESPTASCTRIWLEHNVFDNGLKGMKVHGDLLFENCKEEDCSCMAVLTSESGEVSIPGDLLHVSLRPGFDHTRFSDISIFIPFNLLPREMGEHKYKVILNLYNNAQQSTPVKIGESEYADFTYTSN